MDGLTDQGTARRTARQLNAERTSDDALVAVAVPYPYDSWGGAEEGWTVAYVVAGQALGVA